MAWIGTAIVTTFGIAAICIIARFGIWPTIKSVVKFFTKL